MIHEPEIGRAAAAGNRRSFVRGAMAGLATPLVATRATLAQGVGVGLPPARLTGRPAPEAERPAPRPEAERVGFAIVGLGSFALNQIIPSFGEARHARLAALVSGSPDKAKSVGQAFGVAEEHRYTYDDFDRIAQDPTVQVVYVITPNALHEELVVRAAKAGKHVLCEKPMAPTPEAASG